MAVQRMWWISGLLGALVLAGHANAEERPWFVGVRYHAEAIRVEANLQTQPEHRDTPGLVVGRRVLGWLPLSLEYAQRELEWQNMLFCPGFCPAPPVVSAGQFEMRTLALVARPGGELRGALAWHATLGLMDWDAEATPFDPARGGVGPLYGIGLAYPLSDAWRVDLEWRRARLRDGTYGREQVRSLSLGLNYHF